MKGFDSWVVLVEYTFEIQTENHALAKATPVMYGNFGVCYIDEICLLGEVVLVYFHPMLIWLLFLNWVQIVPLLSIAQKSDTSISYYGKSPCVEVSLFSPNILSR